MLFFFFFFLSIVGLSLSLPVELAVVLKSVCCGRARAKIFICNRFCLERAKPKPLLLEAERVAGLWETDKHVGDSNKRGDRPFRRSAAPSRWIRSPGAARGLGKIAVCSSQFSQVQGKDFW